jgi:hypothetical protein
MRDRPVRPRPPGRPPRERARFVARVMRIVFSVTKRKETQTIRGQTVVCAAVTDERLRTGDTSRHLSAPSSDHAARHPVGSSRAHLHPMGAIMH